MTIAFVLGTRPEAIKLWPVIEETRKAQLPILLLSTGQQANLLPPLLEELGLAPDRTLARKSNLTDFLSTALLWVARCTHDTDAIIVQGDTTTALAGALAGFYSETPVVHVEAGLRTYGPYPYPEEGNRRLIGQIAALHCAPTSAALTTIIQEKLPGRIIYTGNTIVDALHRIRNDSGSKEIIDVLVTLHRRESWSAAHSIAKAVIKATEGLKVRWVLHANRELVYNVTQALAGSDVETVPPLGYRQFISSLVSTRVVITDSGGVIEEAASLGKPAIVLRDATERPEASNAVLLPYAQIEELPTTLKHALIEPQKPLTVFGDGRAAGRIVKEVLEMIKNQDDASLGQICRGSCFLAGYERGPGYSERQ